MVPPVPLTVKPNEDVESSYHDIDTGRAVVMHAIEMHRVRSKIRGRIFAGPELLNLRNNEKGGFVMGLFEVAVTVPLRNSKVVRC